MLAGFVESIFFYLLCWWFMKLDTKRMVLIRGCAAAAVMLFCLVSSIVLFSARLGDSITVFIGVIMLVIGILFLIRMVFDMYRYKTKEEDPALTIKITNKFYCYDLNTNMLSGKKQPTKYRKNGYLAFDEKGRKIGIVYMADDNRTLRYGNAEIMFFKAYETEYGSWRVIRENGKYLPFEELEEKLKTGDYICTTDKRLR